MPTAWLQRHQMASKIRIWRRGTAWQLTWSRNGQQRELKFCRHETRGKASQIRPNDVSLCNAETADEEHDTPGAVLQSRSCSMSLECIAAQHADSPARGRLQLVSTNHVGACKPTRPNRRSAPRLCRRTGHTTAGGNEIWRRSVGSKKDSEWPSIQTPPNAAN